MKFIRRITIILFVIFLTFNSCAQKENQEEHLYTNELINESSPYLLQHAHNPVNWYPWGKEALDRSRSEGKLMLVSIGYSACHWCHVMERESYEDTTVARVMNENYISIKIDREERPDIDQVYIEAAQILTGRAGWPLNVITLPDATPVFAGTYFPRDQWLKILTQVQDIYVSDPDRLADQARKIMDNLQRLNSAEEITGRVITSNDIKKAVQGWKSNMDRKYGGLQSSQKFPLPGGIHQLLNYGYLQGDKEALELVELTLDKMALGGIYDHVGGGFHRYTVERTWKIPHFEKMLYDNGQLVSLYAEAYKLFRNELYLRVIERTLDFIQKEMMNEEGGFYSSYDADSDGEEGKFYVWTADELRDVLKDDAEEVMDYYTMEEKGNWEDGKNILYAKSSPEKYFDDIDLNIPLEQHLNSLKKERNKRIKPGLDDKVLTAWNALMLQGFIDAYQATGSEKYLQVALKNANFIVDKQMHDDGRLNRNYKDGVSVINAFLDDYAFTINAFVNLYQVTFDIKWLELAVKLCDYSILHFYNSQRNLFSYKSDIDEELIVSKYNTNDNVIPSGNSMMATNLFVLGNLYYEGKPEYLEIAKAMVQNISEDFTRYPYYHYGWMPLVYNQAYGFYEIAIVGPSHKDLRKSMQENFIPDAIYLGGPTDTELSLLESKLVQGETYIYVCRDKYCKLPVKETGKAISLIER